MTRIKVLALDLERTLISDAMNREPRPGLCKFLHFCVGHFERVVLFTSVNRKQAFDALNELREQGHVPAELMDKVEYIVWESKYKDLRNIPGASVEEVLFVDDDAGWVLPGQEAQYIAIAEYDPYLVRGTDEELQRLRTLLETYAV